MGHPPVLTDQDMNGVKSGVKVGHRAAQKLANLNGSNFSRPGFRPVLVEIITA